jgi:ABC-2 type transport system ATP-binding protein
VTDRPKPPSRGDPLISAQNLSRHYGPVVAVRDLSFNLYRGQIAGLLGPNGAGKSTTLRMLVGFQVPSAGRVVLAGRDVFRQGAEAKKHVGYLPENPGLYGEMRVREYLEHVARLRGLSGGRRASAVDAAMELWKLGDMEKRSVGHLSRGYRQRVGLAQATLADPEILILDEPTTGLDPNQAAELRAYLRRKSADSAILVSTHLLAEATSLCDHLIIMHRGDVVAQGPREEISARASGEATLHAVLRGGEEIGSLARSRGLRAERRGGESPYTWIVGGELEDGEREQLLQEVLQAHGDLVEWSAGRRTLEEVFRSLTLDAPDSRPEDGARKRGER